MKEFVNRSGNDLNKRLLEVENVIRGGDGEIKTLEVKVSRLDTETTVEGTPLDADSMNTIIRNMILKELSENLNEKQLYIYDANQIVLPSIIETNTIELPLEGEKGSPIFWESQNGVIEPQTDSEEAKVNRSDVDQEEILTANVGSGSLLETRTFNILVKKLTDQEMVYLACAALNLYFTEIGGFVRVPKTGLYNSNITWSVEDENKNVLTNVLSFAIKDGEYEVTRYTLNQDITVVLKATITIGTASATKEFRILVKKTGPSAQELVNMDKELLTKNIEVTEDFDLPQATNGSGVTWTSTNEEVIEIVGNTAKVTPQYEDVEVILIAELELEGAVEEATLTVLVKGTKPTPEEMVKEEISKLSVPETVSENFSLSQSTNNEVTVTWSSSNEEVISINDYVASVVKELDSQEVTLTATVKSGTYVERVEYKVVVAALTEIERVTLASEKIVIPSAVSESFSLPTVGEYETVIIWSCESPYLTISEDGKTAIVTKGGEDVNVELVASVEIENSQTYKTVFFIVTIKELTDSEKVTLAKENLTLSYSTYDSDFTLPTTGLYNTTITWSSSNTNIVYVTSSGYAYVSRTEYDEEITLTATIKGSSISKTKQFTITILADETQTPDMGGDDGNESEESIVTYSISNQYLMWTGTNTSGIIEIEFTNGSGYVEVSLDESYFNASISGNYSSSVDIDISEKTQPDLTMTSIFDVYISVYDSDDILLGTEVGQISYE